MRTTLLLIILTGLTGRSVVVAQDEYLITPTLEPAQPADVLSSDESTFTLPQPVAPSAMQFSPRVDVCYWVVSSRQSRQSPDDPTCCDLSVQVCSPNGQFRASSLSELQTSISPQVPVCIFTHGSFVTWTGHLKEIPYTYRWLRSGAPGCPLQVIFFSWPSDVRLHCGFTRGVVRLGEYSGYNGFHLARVISHLPNGVPVCLMGHSHGSRASASALHLIGGGVEEGCRLSCPVGQHRYRAVYAAAALDHHWLNPGEKYDRAPCVAECTVILKNRCDFALSAYPLQRLGSRKALGEVGLTWFDRRRLDPATSARLTELDVTRHLGVRHIWPYYLSHPDIARCIAPSIYFRGHTHNARVSGIAEVTTPGGATVRQRRRFFILRDADFQPVPDSLFPRSPTITRLTQLRW